MQINLPGFKNPNDSPRRQLRYLRYRLDRIGLAVLHVFALLLIPFRSKPTAILPYATFYGDGIATQHHVQFLEEEHFLTAFSISLSELPVSMRSDKVYANLTWRAHICAWGAEHSLNLRGDFIELGVWYGIIPRTICEIYKRDERFRTRNYFLVDSWGHMPGSHPHPNYQEDIFEGVKAKFKPFANVQLVRGLVPSVLPKVRPQSPNQTVGCDKGAESMKVAYLTIDMNGSVAERSALEYYYPKLESGAFVYLDDYGWGYEGLVETVNEFLLGKPEKLLHLPTGQSIFFKV